MSIKIKHNYKQLFKNYILLIYSIHIYIYIYVYIYIYIYKYYLWSPHSYPSLLSVNPIPYGALTPYAALTPVQ